MQVDNSFIISLYNRYTIVDGDRVMHPIDSLLTDILSQGLDSFEVVVVDFGSTDTDFGWLRKRVKRSILVTLQETFSLGRARNVGCRIATGKRLFVLDCDMSLPHDFAATLIPDVDDGFVCFPLYMLTHRNGKDARQGQGWGNAAMLKTAWHELCEKGLIWQEKTSYGGEDLSLASPIVKGGKYKYKRYFIPGFRHVWHPKGDGEWYRGEGSTAR